MASYVAEKFLVAVLKEALRQEPNAAGVAPWGAEGQFTAMLFLFLADHSLANPIVKDTTNLQWDKMSGLLQKPLGFDYEVSNPDRQKQLVELALYRGSDLYKAANDKLKPETNNYLFIQNNLDSLLNLTSPYGTRVTLMPKKVPDPKKPTPPDNPLLILVKSLAKHQALTTSSLFEASVRPLMEGKIVKKEIKLNSRQDSPYLMRLRNEDDKAPEIKTGAEAGIVKKVQQQLSDNAKPTIIGATEVNKAAIEKTANKLNELNTIEEKIKQLNTTIDNVSKAIGSYHAAQSAADFNSQSNKDHIANISEMLLNVYKNQEELVKEFNTASDNLEDDLTKNPTSYHSTLIDDLRGKLRDQTNALRASDETVKRVEDQFSTVIKAQGERSGELPPIKAAWDANNPGFSQSLSISKQQFAATNEFNKTATSEVPDNQTLPSADTKLPRKKQLQKRFSSPDLLSSSANKQKSAPRSKDDSDTHDLIAADLINSVLTAVRKIPADLFSFPPDDRAKILNKDSLRILEITLANLLDAPTIPREDIQQFAISAGAAIFLESVVTSPSLIQAMLLSMPDIETYVSPNALREDIAAINKIRDELTPLLSAPQQAAVAELVKAFKITVPSLIPESNNEPSLLPLDIAIDKILKLPAVQTVQKRDAEQFNLLKHNLIAIKRLLQLVKNPPLLESKSVEFFNAFARMALTRSFIIANHGKSENIAPGSTDSMSKLNTLTTEQFIEEFNTITTKELYRLNPLQQEAIQAVDPNFTLHGPTDELLNALAESATAAVNKPNVTLTTPPSTPASDLAEITQRINIFTKEVEELQTNLDHVIEPTETKGNEIQGLLNTLLIKHTTLFSELSALDTKPIDTFSEHIVLQSRLDNAESILNEIQAVSKNYFSGVLQTSVNPPDASQIHSQSTSSEISSTRLPADKKSVSSITPPADAADEDGIELTQTRNATPMSNQKFASRNNRPADAKGASRSNRNSLSSSSESSSSSNNSSSDNNSDSEIDNASFEKNLAEIVSGLQDKINKIAEYMARLKIAGENATAWETNKTSLNTELEVMQKSAPQLPAPIGTFSSAQREKWNTTIPPMMNILLSELRKAYEQYQLIAGNFVIANLSKPPTRAASPDVSVLRKDKNAKEPPPSLSEHIAAQKQAAAATKSKQPPAPISSEENKDAAIKPDDTKAAVENEPNVTVATQPPSPPSDLAKLSERINSFKTAVENLQKNFDNTTEPTTEKANEIQKELNALINEHATLFTELSHLDATLDNPFNKHILLQSRLDNAESILNEIGIAGNDFFSPVRQKSVNAPDADQIHSQSISSEISSKSFAVDNSDDNLDSKDAAAVAASNQPSTTTSSEKNKDAVAKSPSSQPLNPSSSRRSSVSSRSVDEYDSDEEIADEHEEDEIKSSNTSTAVPPISSLTGSAPTTTPPPVNATSSATSSTTNNNNQPSHSAAEPPLPLAGDGDDDGDDEKKDDNGKKKPDDSISEAEKIQQSIANTVNAFEAAIAGVNQLLDDISSAAENPDKWKAQKTDLAAVISATNEESFALYESVNNLPPAEQKAIVNNRRIIELSAGLNDLLEMTNTTYKQTDGIAELLAKIMPLHQIADNLNDDIQQYNVLTNSVANFNEEFITLAAPVPELLNIGILNTTRRELDDLTQKLEAAAKIPGLKMDGQENRDDRDSDDEFDPLDSKYDEPRIPTGSPSVTRLPPTSSDVTLPSDRPASPTRRSTLPANSSQPLFGPVSLRRRNSTNTTNPPPRPDSPDELTQTIKNTIGSGAADTRIVQRRESRNRPLDAKTERMTDVQRVTALRAMGIQVDNLLKRATQLRDQDNTDPEGVARNTAGLRDDLQKLRTTFDNLKPYTDINLATSINTSFATIDGIINDLQKSAQDQVAAILQPLATALAAAQSFQDKLNAAEPLSEDELNSMNSEVKTWLNKIKDLTAKASQNNNGLQAAIQSATNAMTDVAAKISTALAAFGNRVDDAKDEEPSDDFKKALADLKNANQDATKFLSSYKDGYFTTKKRTEAANNIETINNLITLLHSPKFKLTADAVSELTAADENIKQLKVALELIKTYFNNLKPIGDGVTKLKEELKSFAQTIPASKLPAPDSTSLEHQLKEFQNQYTDLDKKYKAILNTNFPEGVASINSYFKEADELLKSINKKILALKAPPVDPKLAKVLASAEQLKKDIELLDSKVSSLTNSEDTSAVSNTLSYLKVTHGMLVDEFKGIVTFVASSEKTAIPELLNEALTTLNEISDKINKLKTTPKPTSPGAKLLSDLATTTEAAVDLLQETIRLTTQTPTQSIIDSQLAKLDAIKTKAKDHSAATLPAEMSEAEKTLYKTNVGKLLDITKKTDDHINTMRTKLYEISLADMYRNIFSLNTNLVKLTEQVDKASTKLTNQIDIDGFKASAEQYVKDHKKNQANLISFNLAQKLPNPPDSIEHTIADMQGLHAANIERLENIQQKLKTLKATPMPDTADDIVATLKSMKTEVEKINKKVTDIPANEISISNLVKFKKEAEPYAIRLAAIRKLPNASDATVVAQLLLVDAAFKELDDNIATKSRQMLPELQQHGDQLLLKTQGLLNTIQLPATANSWQDLQAGINETFTKYKTDEAGLQIQLSLIHDLVDSEVRNLAFHSLSNNLQKINTAFISIQDEITKLNNLRKSNTDAARILARLDQLITNANELLGKTRIPLTGDNDAKNRAIQQFEITLNELKGFRDTTVLPATATPAEQTAFNTKSRELNTAISEIETGITRLRAGVNPIPPPPPPPNPTLDALFTTLKPLNDSAQTILKEYKNPHSYYDVLRAAREHLDKLIPQRDLINAEVRGGATLTQQQQQELNTANSHITQLQDAVTKLNEFELHQDEVIDELIIARAGDLDSITGTAAEIEAQYRDYYLKNHSAKLTDEQLDKLMLLNDQLTIIALLSNNINKRNPEVRKNLVRQWNEELLPLQKETRNYLADLTILQQRLTEFKSKMEANILVVGTPDATIQQLRANLQKVNETLDYTNRVISNVNRTLNILTDTEINLASASQAEHLDPLDPDYRKKVLINKSRFETVQVFEEKDFGNVKTKALEDAGVFGAAGAPVAGIHGEQPGGLIVNLNLQMVMVTELNPPDINSVNVLSPKGKSILQPANLNSVHSIGVFRIAPTQQARSSTDQGDFRLEVHKIRDDLNPAALLAKFVIDNRLTKYFNKNGNFKTDVDPTQQADLYDRLLILFAPARQMNITEANIKTLLEDFVERGECGGLRAFWSGGDTSTQSMAKDMNKELMRVLRNPTDPSLPSDTALMVAKKYVDDYVDYRETQTGRIKANDKMSLTGDREIRLAMQFYCELMAHEIGTPEARRKYAYVDDTSGKKELTERIPRNWSEWWNNEQGKQYINMLFKKETKLNRVGKALEAATALETGLPEPKPGESRRIDLGSPTTQKEDVLMRKAADYKGPEIKDFTAMLKQKHTSIALDPHEVELVRAKMLGENRLQDNPGRPGPKLNLPRP